MTLLMFGSLVEEFRLTRARQALLFRDSTDTEVPFAGVEVRRGRTWSFQEGVNRAGAQHLFGMVATQPGQALEHPNTFLHQCQGRDEATAHPRGGEDRRSGNSPQQEAGQGQAVGLDPLGAHYWQEYQVDRTGNEIISDVPPIPFNLLTCCHGLC